MDKGITYTILAIAIVMAILPVCTQAQPIPTPYGIAGIVYMSDGVTQAPAGTSFSVNDTTSGDFIAGTTGAGPDSGAYSVTIDGDDGDTVIVAAWTATHHGTTTVTLSGDMNSIGVTINMPSGSDTTPPAGISNLDETDKGTTWILWDWTNPDDSDFNHTEVYINGVFKADVYAPGHAYDATGLNPETTYKIGTRTVDDSGNVNTTWVKDTAITCSTDDYFVYGRHPVSGYAVDGYKINDTAGLLYVDNGGVCYIYQVTIPPGSDPNKHPLNPIDPGPMAPRSFTLVGTHNFASDCGWSKSHKSEFYVDGSYIYYGAYSAIEKWVKNANGSFGAYLGKVTDKAGNLIPGNKDETFAYDAANNIWYSCSRGRTVHSFDADVDTAWKTEFKYPSYSGGHHDGMEFASGYLWISDMTSDYIGQWQYTGTGPYNGWNETYRYSYTYGQDVEGMGFEPFGHLWITSGSELYEIGGGRIAIVLTFESANLTGIRCDNFTAGDAVYAIGSGLTPNTTYNIYVVTDTTWTDGMSIPSRVPGTALTVTTDGTGSIPTGTSVWTNSIAGDYDIVVDVDANGLYDTGIDGLDDMDTGSAGFIVISGPVSPPPSVYSSTATGAPKDAYRTNEDVYATGSGFAAGTNVDIYVVPDQDWNDGDPVGYIVAVSGGTVSINGNVDPVLIWHDPLVAGVYDIVVDANRNGVYDALADGLDSEIQQGFVVIADAPPSPPVSVPTLAPHGIIALIGLLCVIGMFRIRRRFN